MEPFLRDSLIAKYAVVGAFLLVLTGGTIVFAVRAIRLIESEGRADRRTVWRLATLRVLVVIAGLSGGLSVFLIFAIMLGELAGVLSTASFWSSRTLPFRFCWHDAARRE